MKILKKEPIRVPINAMPGDTISLNVMTDTGEELEVAHETITKPMIVDSTVIFEVEKGDFGKDIECGIGGAFLQTKKHKLGLGIQID